MTVAAMEVVREDEQREVETAMPDRRTNDWRDPKFVVQMIMLLGAILSFYLLSERRTTTLEIAAANLNEKAARIESQMGSIAASVQSVSTVTTRLEARDDARTREIEEIKRKLELQDVYNDEFTKKLVEMNAELKNRSRP